MKPHGIFTQELWESITSLYSELKQHPFVNELAEGTLSKTSFAHYLTQDILYIHDDGVAFETLSKRASLPNEKAFFKAMAEDCIATEQALHAHFLKAFELKEAKIKSPAIESYTDFLIYQSTNASFPVATTALLPCFWVYSSIGNHISSLEKPNNPYQKWIETYKGDEYVEFCTSFIKIIERLAKTASDKEKKEMRLVFKQATQFELNFFEESFSK